MDWKIRYNPLIEVKGELPERVDIFLPQYGMTKREFDLLVLNAVIKLLSEIEKEEGA
jgi:hypothetical protein